ncbi:hypothetical protein [Glycomyces sp. YM15]|uniref:hypothetical protein n=1 Tax=Glycomyces sp. YM15 TaxID=2800446 RepID=UPI0019665647|nr:hypothetical protein [Glycomyces sp. YM15]
MTWIGSRSGWSSNSTTTVGRVVLGPAPGPAAGHPSTCGRNRRSTAELADLVFPAITDSVRVLEAHDLAEAEHFRTTIGVVIDAADRAHKGEPSPVMAEMVRKINDALNA